MPNIPTYEAPALDLRPTETGIHATEAAARRIQAEFNEKANALQGAGTAIGGAIRTAGDMYVAQRDHEEISNGAPATIATEAKLGDEWDQITKDPNAYKDPTIAQKFLTERVEPAFDELGKAFTTEKSQQWYERQRDAFRQHMFTKTTADMGSLAAKAAVTNLTQITNTLSNNVRNDPSSLDYSLETLESSVGATIDSMPHLKGTQAATVRSEFLQRAKESLVKNAALGHIEKTGEVPDWVTSDKYSGYIKGDELKQFQQAAKGYKRLNDAENRAAKVDADREARNKFNKAIVQLDMSLIDENGIPNVTQDHIKAFKEIVKQNADGAALEEAKVRSVSSSLQRGVEKTNRIKVAADDPATQQDLTNRLFDPDRPTTNIDILLAKNEGKLSDRSARNLAAIVKEQAGWLKDPIMKVTMNGAKQQLGTDPVGAGKYASFVQDFLPQYMAAKRGGTATPGDLDLKNPDSMISKAMRPYQRNLSEIMTDRITHGLMITEPSAPVTPGQPIGSIPPVKDRVINETYQTPKGPLRWTGTGWVK